MNQPPRRPGPMDTRQEEIRAGQRTQTFSDVPFERGELPDPGESSVRVVGQRGQYHQDQHGYQEETEESSFTPPRPHGFDPSTLNSESASKPFSSGGFSKRALVGARDYLEFTLPPENVGMNWSLPQEALTFSMIELTPGEEMIARKRAPTLDNGMPDPFGVITEQAKEAIYTIGGAPVTYDQINTWWSALGPKGTKWVENVYQAMHFPSGDLGEKALASARRGRG